MTMLRTGVLALVLAGSIASHARAASPGEEGFRRLSAKQIRHAFVGRIFSDEVHFAERYLADGKIESESMGTKKTYSWRTDEDRLCISDSHSDVCYFVWAKSNAIRLLPDGPGIPGDGYVR